MYAYANKTEVYLSLGELEQDTIAELADIARSHPQIAKRLTSFEDSTRFINYVMPTELFVSEVPMYIPEGKAPTHEAPGSKDQSRYKIIFTEARFGPDGLANGPDIIRRAINKKPIVEVWIDRETQKVENILSTTSDKFYEGMPVPVF
ncbi:hypothetical protein [Aliifodinibius sp. S!AR15-10]|uniref:hypothetical protein n=1 Tax=Aliifodinibius sp. S!AR15-10 TaxID=2950437 RepID=UPI002870A6EA|nr:hypothetical protein [Aliifodinibius sp. S!AR15-10]